MISRREFFSTLRNGPYAWPGGYPLYFVCKDGEALSFKAARQNAKQIGRALRQWRTEPSLSQWAVIGVDVNWEDPNLYCADSGERIESAYAEEREET